MITPTNEHRINFAHFSLDLVNECLWNGSKEIKVRPKAFALLHYLIVRPGQLVTKEELLSAVWPETFVSDAVLKVTIRQLRETLADDPKSPQFIETAHRRGYRFIARINAPPQLPTTEKPADALVSSASTARLVKAYPAVVGRDDTLLRLEGWLQQSLQGERQIVFLTGEAGIGKTALVDAFVGGLPSDTNIRVARGQCLEQYGTGEAYLPVLDAIGRLCREEPQVTHLIRPHAPMWLLQMPSLVSPADRELLTREVAGATHERMLREMGEALDALTAETPLILILEDLHWSDHSTLNLISYLANQRQTAHLMLIGTHRNVELTVGRHSLKAVKQELLAKQLCFELPIEYLSENAVTKYLSFRFPSHRFPAGLARLIHKRTDGNPLFMVNAVDYLLAEKVIVEVEGQMVLVDDLTNVEVGVPDNIKQMIEMQVDHLDVKMQRLIETASVAGVEFSPLALLAGLEEEQSVIERRCEELARDGQFIRDCGFQELPNGEVVARYGFVHALYQNVLYERIPPSRRFQLHRRIGERGEEVYGDRVGEIAGELAMHFERGRDYQRATNYFQRAADNAMRRFAYREAVALARKGIELIKKVPDSPDRLAQELCLHLTLGVPLVAIEGYASPNVGSVYLRARELQRQLGDTPDVAEVLWGVWTYYTLRADLRTARETAEEFLRLSQRLSYPGFAMRAHLVMHVTLMHQGEFVPALEHHAQAAKLYDPQRHRDDAFFYSQHPGVALRCFEAWTLWYLGKPQQSLERLEEALAIARALDEPHGLAHTLLFAAVVHQLRREPKKAQEFAESVLAIASEHGMAMYRVQASITRGWALAQHGLSESGINLMRQGIADYKNTGTKLLLAQFLGLLAEALGNAGQTDEGLREVDEALNVAGSSEDASYLAELHRLKGELSLAKQLAGDAEECFKESIATAQRQHAKSWELRSATSLARLYHSQNKNDEARNVLRPVVSDFSEEHETKDLREANSLLAEL